MNKIRFVIGLIIIIPVFLANLIVHHYVLALGMGIGLIGGGMNILCTYLNGWKMPVKSWGVVESNLHRPWGNNIRLPWLADIFGNHNFRFSVGDMVAAVGVSIVIVGIWFI